MSFPFQTEPEEEQYPNGNDIDESAHYPKFSKVHKYPNPYKDVGQRINTNPNENKYAKNINPKIKQKTNPKMIPKANQKVYPKANPKIYPKAYPKEYPYPEAYPEPYPYPQEYPKEYKKVHKHTHAHKNKVKKVPVPVTKYVAVPVGPPMLMPVVTQGTMAVYPQTQPTYQYQYAQYGASPYDYNYGVGNAGYVYGY